MEEVIFELESELPIPERTGTLSGVTDGVAEASLPITSEPKSSKFSHEICKRHRVQLVLIETDPLTDAEISETVRGEADLVLSLYVLVGKVAAGAVDPLCERLGADVAGCQDRRPMDRVLLEHSLSAGNIGNDCHDRNGGVAVGIGGRNRRVRRLHDGNRSGNRGGNGRGR